MTASSKLLVQKYGGSSVGSVERIAAVVARIARDRAAGRDVVAREPGFQLLAYRGLRALDEQGGGIQALWKRAMQIVRHCRSTHKGHAATPQGVVESAHVDAP